MKTEQTAIFFLASVLLGAVLYSTYVSNRCKNEHFFQIGTKHYECLPYRPGEVK